MALFIKDVNRIYNLSNKAVSLKCRKGDRLLLPKLEARHPHQKERLKSEWNLITEPPNRQIKKVNVPNQTTGTNVIIISTEREVALTKTRS